jgi:transposase
VEYERQSKNRPQEIAEAVFCCGVKVACRRISVLRTFAFARGFVEHRGDLRAAKLCGGYSTVKSYVRGEQLHIREMFVPLVHPPGEAQADFGEALVVIAGVEQKAHYLAMDLPHSDGCFVIAFPAETTESFLEGHASALEYFGAVPTRILYDNAKIAVARILGGEERTKTKAFLELQSHYLFADKFGRPAKDNDKPGW